MVGRRVGTCVCQLDPVSNFLDHTNNRLTKHTQEQAVFKVSHLLLITLCEWTVPVIAACLAVCYRALSGRRAVTTALVRVCVCVSVMCVSKIRV